MALALSAVGSSSGTVPMSYVLEALARRWGVPPWVVEAEAPLRWVHRGLTYMELEGAARRSRHG